MPDSFRPVSPGYAGTRSQSYYFQLALYAGGNVLAVAICLLLWFCWDVLSAFQEPLVWSYLCSLSLRDVKRYLVDTARRELQTSSFIVCCAKLAFLPAVIVWQLFEELRDKLQSKYHELQQKKQGTPTKPAAGAKGAAAATRGTSKGAAPAVSNLDAILIEDKDRSESDSEQRQQGKASAAAGTVAVAGLASTSTANGSLQQCKQTPQQQGLRQRKPPLVPTSTAVGKHSSSRKQGSAGSTTADKTGKATVGIASVGKPLADNSSAKQTPHSSSKLQRRLQRYKRIAVRQLKWYSFCLIELLKFILGGLWPQQQKAQPQPQPQQQQQQQQLLVAPSVRVGRLSSAASYSSPMAAASVGVAAVGALEQYASTQMRVSAAGSISSSCMSEHGVWTPQQQQQGWQQQQEQQRRLSISHSSPSLALAAVQPQSSLRHQLQYNSTAVAGAAADERGISQDDLQQQHMSVDDSVLLSTSFAGWGVAQQHQLSVSPVLFGQSGLQQQQQQCELASRSSSNGATSSTSSSKAAAAAAAAAASTLPASASIAAGEGPGLGARSSDYVNHGNGAVTPKGSAHYGSMTSPPNRGHTAAFPVPTSALDLNGTTAAAAARFTSAASSMSFGAAGSFAAPWEGFAAGSGYQGLGLTNGPPTAPSSVIIGLGSSSGSPSNILFKWLLRGIVLFEGWRYAQSCWDPDQPLFVLLLVVGGTLAVAFGLPVLLLPSSLLWRSPLHDTVDQGEQCRDGAASSAAAAAGTNTTEVTAAAAAAGCDCSSDGERAGSAGIRSPFEQQCRPGEDAADGVHGSSSSWAGQSVVHTVWTFMVELLVHADTALRNFCASSFLDTAVSGFIVVGLILGSVILSVVLLVQVGEESRQAVLHMNTLVRQKVDSEGALRQGVRSLLQEYEGQVTSMLRDSLPSVTQYVESRAVEFLISHNLSRVLLDLETVKAALHLPGDCSEAAKIQLAVQLANSSLAVQDLGQQRQKLQQQLETEQQLIGSLAARYEALQITSSTTAAGTTRQYSGGMGSMSGCEDAPPAAAAEAPAIGSSSSGSIEVAHALLESQQSLTVLQSKLHGVEARYDAASEQLQLAQLRLHNCHPAATAAAAAGHARGFSGFLSSFWPHTTPAAATAAAAAAGGGGPETLNHSSTVPGPGAQLSQISVSVAHARRMLSAVTKFDFGTASNEAAAALGYLFPQQQELQQEQQPQQQGDCSALPDAEQDSGNLGHNSGLQQDLGFPPGTAATAAVHVVNGDVGAADTQCLFSPQQQQQQQQQPQCHYNRSGGSFVGSSTNCSSNSSGAASSSSPSSSSAVPIASSSSSSSGSSGAAATGSIMRVAQGAAYPLITSWQTLSSVFLAGVGSTTAVALGTGLGVLRLGLGVVKFLVQLGVFASVLYTLLALDIDPVEQLVRLLPMSEASQDRASRAVTKAMRGVFVSSLKLAAFHAGFTWLTLRAFNTHFVCLASAASAVVAVLPLVPVALVVLPAVLELVLLRGAPVKGFVLAALHLGAYYFGDDLIFREVEPTLPYLVGLGVFGGMYTFKNPLQGVLLGPMVLALLSVGYNLHRALY